MKRSIKKPKHSAVASVSMTMLIFFAALALVQTVKVKIKDIPAAPVKVVLDENTLSDKDLFCFVQTLYHETRGEGRLGMAAVAYVILNRVQSPYYPKTICGVVWEKRWSNEQQRYIAQFEWTLDGKPDDMRDIESIRLAVDVALGAYRGTIKNPVGNIVNYINPKKCNPAWAQAATYFIIIGNHKFLDFTKRNA